MQKLLATIVALVVLAPVFAHAQFPPQTINQGGTGWNAFTQGSIPIGPGSGLTGLRFGTSTNLTYATSTDILTLLHASTTDLSALSRLTIGTTATTTILGTATSTFAFGINALYLNVTGTAATSTFARGIDLAGGCFSVLGVCVGGTGTVTSIATTYPVTGGPITTTGTIALAFGTTTSNTWAGTQTFGNLIATNSTTTSLYVTNLTSALALFDSNGQATEYAGIDCTNQFVRDVSAAGAGTCATVGAADVSLANLTATDSTLTFSGTYNGSTARTIGITLSNPNSWTGLQQFANASSTNFTVWNNFYIPTSTNPTIGVTGQIAINTTAASSSIRFHDGTAERSLPDVTQKSFNYPTTTPAGTTTIQVAGGFRSWTATSLGCNSVGGTVGVQIGDGTASSTYITSGTSATVTTLNTLSANNSFNMGEVWYIALGTWSATAISQVDCTYAQRYDAD